MMAAMMGIMWAAMMFIIEGFNRHAVDGFLSGWPFLAIIVGFGTFWLIFYHAGLDPQRAFDRLFLWGTIAFIGFLAGGFWFAYYPHVQVSSQSQRDAQRDFRKAILSAPVPSVAVEDKLLDLSSCTVFGLKPGMSRKDALAVVNGSGYFAKQEKPAVCSAADKCSHYVSFIKDGLYLRVEFKGDPHSPAPVEQVSSVVLSLSEEANAYFDESQVMERFLKLIGPNGFSIGDAHTAWRDIKNDMELQAYTYERKFWAVFSRLGDRPNPPGSGVRV
jgi:hypothetical protein